MEFSIKGGRPENARTDCIVVVVPPGRRPTQREGTVLAALDAAAEGRLGRILARGDLRDGVGRTLMLHGIDGLRAERVLLVAHGPRGPLDAASYRKLARGALGALLATEAHEALWCVDADVEVEGHDAAWCATETAILAATETYRFDAFRSEPGEAPPPKLERLAVHAPRGRARLERAVARGAAIAEGVNFARTLGNLPGNVCHPTRLADEAHALADHDALTTRVVEEDEMRELGMGAFLSVTAGTDQPAKLIVMEYRGTDAKRKPRVLVGKGITFDTGGISLKPGPGMDEMKFDMCGAASVFGVMKSLIALEAPVNVVALVAAAENMPSGGASRPGDIVRTMSEQTVEILNTDAEGRLVLCDALTYAERFEPRAVVDVATLTGACVVALGNHATGLFANNDDLARALLEAGERTGDRAWRMPLWDDYQQQLKSNFADMANVGGREAGSITAACFLSRFARRWPWAHLDVAGTAWLSGARKGATGRPVRLLLDWLESA